LGDSTSAATPPLVVAGVAKQASGWCAIRAWKQASGCWSERAYRRNQGSRGGVADRPRAYADAVRPLRAVARRQRGTAVRGDPDVANVVASSVARPERSSRPPVRSRTRAYSRSGRPPRSRRPQCGLRKGTTLAPVDDVDAF
jgi:hypothetical protein